MRSGQSPSHSQVDRWTYLRVTLQTKQSRHGIRLLITFDNGHRMDRRFEPYGGTKTLKGSGVTTRNFAEESRVAEWVFRIDERTHRQSPGYYFLLSILSFGIMRLPYCEL